MIDRHRGTDVSAAVRARQGFVQGRWSVAGLRVWPTTPGIVLAEVDGQRAGVAISSPPGWATDGPAGRTNELAAQRFGVSDYFLYGPAVVDDAYRRRGVLDAMVRGLFTDAAVSYAVGVAFIEDANTASMTAHTRLGFTGFAAFTLGDRGYRCLSRATCSLGRSAQDGNHRPGHASHRRQRQAGVLRAPGDARDRNQR
ncbi:MAG: hypothetical protein ABI746_01225 [Dermatophilaceae bacterium]